MTVDFAHALVDYLALRRRLGHKLAEVERVLDRFVVYLDFVGAEAVTLEVALEFILDPDLDAASTLASRRLQAVRGFTRYLAGIEAALVHDLSNALVESTNTKLRLLARMAYGFKEPEHLIALALLDRGGYCPPLPGRSRP
jgi:hypothetical protein